MFRIKVLLLFSLIIFTGCSQKSLKKPNISEADFKKVSWENLEGFKEDNLDKALEVFKKDCKASKKYKNLEDICLKSNVATDGSFFFKSHFTPYKLLSNNQDEGLITGYYEPLLKGSLERSNKYKYPIYNIPNDLIVVDLSEAYPKLKDYKLRGKLIGKMLIPYDSREVIDHANNKNNPNLKPICYVDNKIDLFFLHIQGSGKVELEDGTILNIGYGEQNGRHYYAIGKKLIEMEEIDRKDISLQTIKEWLTKNPTKRDQILNLNPSYIFFKQSEKGATGSLGTELIAKRNLAVDKNFIPLGFPVFINTTNPIDDKPINQLMIAADVGGAIKGKIRADFFFGNGNEARELAGKMKQSGKLYILIPNNIDIQKEQ